jgi:hypothetical protein
LFGESRNIKTATIFDSMGTHYLNEYNGGKLRNKKLLTKEYLIGTIFQSIIECPNTLKAFNEFRVSQRDQGESFPAFSDLKDFLMCNIAEIVAFPECCDFCFRGLVGIRIRYENYRNLERRVCIKSSSFILSGFLSTLFYNSLINYFRKSPRNLLPRRVTEHC